MTNEERCPQIHKHRPHAWRRIVKDRPAVFDSTALFATGPIANDVETLWCPGLRVRP